MMKNLLLNPQYYKVISITSIVLVLFSGVSFILLMSDLDITVGLIFALVSLIAILICGILFFASMILQKSSKMCRLLFLSTLIISIFSIFFIACLHDLDRHVFNDFFSKNILTFDLNVDEVKFVPTLRHKIFDWSTMFLAFGLPLFTWLSTAISILYKLGGKTD